jgi:argonaute-like protein implicated in RNA metabolism and viral defense
VGAINSEIKKAVERGNNIVLIVLPAFLKNNYKDVKVFAIREQEIISQVITEYTLRKKNIQSIATKVLLQIIAKRGNILWVPQLTC